MPSGKEWNVATGPALLNMEELQADLEELLAEHNRTRQVWVSTAMAKRRCRPSWIPFAWRGKMLDSLVRPAPKRSPTQSSVGDGAGAVA